MFASMIKKLFVKTPVRYTSEQRKLVRMMIDGLEEVRAFAVRHQEDLFLIENQFDWTQGICVNHDVYMRNTLGKNTYENNWIYVTDELSSAFAETSFWSGEKHYPIKSPDGQNPSRYYHSYNDKFDPEIVEVRIAFIDETIEILNKRLELS